MTLIAFKQQNYCFFTVCYNKNFEIRAKTENCKKYFQNINFFGTTFVYKLVNAIFLQP